MKIKQQLNKGFTLIEVLISIMILGIGLLGLAGLQMTGLRNNFSAYHRTQATQFSANIADKIRANAVEAKLFNNSTYSVINPEDAIKKSKCLIYAKVSACLPADMAQQDLFSWHQDVSTILPSGLGRINADNTGVFTVTITWDDNRDDVIDETDPSFEMSFIL